MALCRLGIFLAAAAIVSFHAAEAHRPLANGPTCNPQFSTPEDGLMVPDISISWSVMRIQTCQGPDERAFWLKWKNIDPELPLYVGCGVPTHDRFQWLRVDYMIVGPGLPKLTAEEEAAVPQTILDQVKGLNNTRGDLPEFGGILVRAPADQSTCEHLYSALKGHCTVRHNRCDFYEPFGDSHGWRVVDKEDFLMPVQNATYYVANWLQQNTTGKFSVAIGTWAEDFSTNYGEGPQLMTCQADNGDWGEKATLPEDDPVQYENCDPSVPLEEPGTPWTGPKTCGSCGSWSCDGACEEKNRRRRSEKKDEKKDKQKRTTSEKDPVAEASGTVKGCSASIAAVTAAAAAWSA